MMKRLTHGARCTIKMHSGTYDIVAFRHDLRNGPQHYFGLHNNATQLSASKNPKSVQVKFMKYIALNFHITYQLQDHHHLIGCLLISFMMLRQQEIN